MNAISRHTQLEEDLMTIMEEYLETKLFRDANIPEVNKLFWQLYSRISETALYYTRSGNPNGYGFDR